VAAICPGFVRACNVEVGRAETLRARQTPNPKSVAREVQTAGSGEAADGCADMWGPADKQVIAQVRRDLHILRRDQAPTRAIFLYGAASLGGD
jgi:hypothetical protein